MKVRLAKTAGFCMGVRRAMELTLEAVNRENHRIYSYGPLIHNSQVMDMLSIKGLRTLDKDGEWPEEVETGDTVIIRAHGVPPDERKALKEAGWKVINATCPRVVQVQAIIRRHAKKGYAAIIVGDVEHAEVVGLLGYAEGKGWAIKSEAEIRALPDLEKVIVVAQTTQNRPHFSNMVSIIQDRWPEAVIFNTICEATYSRQEEVRQLANQVQAMIVVGGHNSGNTKRLAEVSRETGTKTIHLETDEELDPDWLANVETVGITAGASTPNWMIKRVARKLERATRRRGMSLRRLPPDFAHAALEQRIYRPGRGFAGPGRRHITGIITRAEALRGGFLLRARHAHAQPVSGQRGRKVQ
ncbi:MAG: 4-hydroxy-3-methylbut-2-enyl diphosphate reductase [Deltaproteobacteria bacterium]|nr:4-hydroxy-3-methylbut-2-enyl diphosphate reductase [Deltaproteobacteria bacterium]